MAARGQVQEFRDRDKLMFKVEQIDLLAPPDAGGEGDIELSADLAGDSAPGLSGGIPLADSGLGGIDLSASAEGSSLGLASEGSSIIPLEGGFTSPPKASGARGGATESPKERSGISVFDVDELETADPSAVTQVTDGGPGSFDDATLESVGSGSGLMDMTRESDDTSLGAAALLDEITQAEGDGAATQETVGASGLFEASGAESDDAGALAVAPAGVAMVAAEQLDGPGSGLTGGLAIGVVAASAVALMTAMLGALGAPMKGLVGTLSSNMLIVVGAVAAVTVIGGGLGFMLGKKS